IAHAVADRPGMGAMKWLDMAEMTEHDHGGSAGMQRFWLLGEDGAGQHIIELKEVAPPSVAQLGSSNALPPESRMSTLKQGFWGRDDPSNFQHVKLGDRTFQLRDEGKSQSLDPTQLKGKAQRDELLGIASYYAGLHARG